MKRFNFVCHGLMWLVEDGDSIQILIPDIKPHSFRQGQPIFGLGALTDLAPGEDWTLAGGITSSGKPLNSLICSRDALMLRKGAFDTVPSLARNRYVLPKPDRIRSFRAAEVGSGIFGSTQPSTAHEAPVVSHDVTCLSYLKVTAPVLIIGPSGPPISIDNPIAATWCLYAQPSVPENLSHDITPMNQLLRFKGTMTNPDFKLAIPTPSDKSHDLAKDIGLGKTHLMNLLELSTPTNSPETDRVGCHMAWVSEP